MRIFLAGASGVIGRRLTPLLIEAGHQVAGTTRSEARAEIVRGCGGEPVVVDGEEGTRSLVAAARAAGASRLIAQSIAWDLPPDLAARLDEHERMVHEFPGVGVVLRYGQFYGPGTYYEDEPPEQPRIEIDEAARRTLPSLKAPAGTIVIAE